jgi:lipopolysaccharide transport system permease protein
MWQNAPLAQAPLQNACSGFLLPVLKKQTALADRERQGGSVPELNPRTTHSILPVAIVRSAVDHRNLIYSLVKREIIGRYRGSVIGLLWAFVIPVFMLAVYTFVFSVVFKARWAGGSDSKVEFALILFAGLLVFNLFSDSINRAPGLIISNANYVKKVVFPLEILPLVALGATGFHFLMSFVVWMAFYLLFFGVPSASIMLLPLVLLPLVLMTLGITWILAALSVYLRDITQITGILTTVLLFLSPIFFPITALPEAYRGFMKINPLAYMVEQARDVMIWGEGIRLQDWGIWMLISLFTSWAGFAIFQKIRKGFADVL